MRATVTGSFLEVSVITTLNGLENNFRFRLMLASIISLMLILAIHRFENCYQNNYS